MNRRQLLMGAGALVLAGGGAAYFFRPGPDIDKSARQLRWSACPGADRTS